MKRAREGAIAYRKGLDASRAVVACTTSFDPTLPRAMGDLTVYWILKWESEKCC
jgi:hypothetical protein